MLESDKQDQMYWKIHLDKDTKFRFADSLEFYNSREVSIAEDLIHGSFRWDQSIRHLRYWASFSEWVYFAPDTIGSLDWYTDTTGWVRQLSLTEPEPRTEPDSRASSSSGLRSHQRLEFDSKQNNRMLDNLTNQLLLITLVLLAVSSLSVSAATISSVSNLR